MLKAYLSFVAVWFGLHFYIPKPLAIYLRFALYRLFFILCFASTDVHHLYLVCSLQKMYIPPVHFYC